MAIGRSHPAVGKSFGSEDFMPGSDDVGVLVQLSMQEWVSKLGGLGRDRDGILLSGSTTMIRLLCAFLGRCLEGNLMVGIGLRVRVLERLICESLHLPQLFDYDGSNQAARWIWQNFNA